MEWDHFDYTRAKAIRERFVPIQKVFDFVSLLNGESLIDIGAGDGHYAFEFAKRNPKSIITALEPGLNGSKLIEHRISNDNISNVKLLKEDACNARDYSEYGVIFFSTVFHDLGCRDKLIRHIAETAQNNSRIIFIEFKKDSEIGPPKEVRISEKELEAIMAKAGFILNDFKELEFHYIHKYIFE